MFLTEIDPQGKSGAPVLVSAEPTAQIDVTLAEIGGQVRDRLDRRAQHRRVRLPGRGRARAARSSRRAAPGDRALRRAGAGLAGGRALRARTRRAASAALLAWEDQLRAPREGRLIHLATVGPDAQIGKERAALVFSASGPPDIEPDGDGFAAVTLAPVHDLPEGVEAHAAAGREGRRPGVAGVRALRARPRR